MAEDAVAFAAAKRRRPCTGGAGDMISALPEHVLHEVLLRVGTVKDMFMLAATCRRWLARFTDRSFLRELLCPAPAAAHGAQECLLGFFFLQDAPAGISFLPAPGRRSPGLTLARTTMASRALVPLAARRGILLVQRVPRRRDTHLFLGVCNHVTGQRHHLAPLDADPSDMCCYAIITAADANNAAGAGRYTFSQLLLATVEVSAGSDWAVHVHSYSAATRSWSAPATLNLVDGCRFSLVGQRSAVVHHGAAHWFWRHDDGSLYRLSVPLGGAAPGAGCVCIAFTRIPAAVSIVDLHNSTSMEKVMDCFLPLRLADETNRTAVGVPYEMDLVDFFMFQLGGLRSAGSSG